MNTKLFAMITSIAFVIVGFAVVSDSGFLLSDTNDEFEVGDLKYEVTDAENKIVKVIGLAENAMPVNLAIKDKVTYEGQVYTVNEIGVGAFEYKKANEGIKNSYIVNLSISGNIKLGAGSFYCCFNLVTVELKGIGDIGNNAFSGCRSLTSVVVEGNGDYVKIGSSAFNGCGSLVSVKLKNVVSIGTAAFSSISSAHIELPSMLKKIDMNAFSGSYLRDITIPKGVTEIGTGAFYRCDYLEKIIVEAGNQRYSTYDGKYLIEDGDRMIATAIAGVGDTISIPEGVVKTAPYSFNSRIGITGICIPSTLEKFESFDIDPKYGEMYESDLFQSFVDIATVTVDYENSHFMSENDVLFSKDKTILYLYPRVDSASAYEVPEEVETIGPFAFSQCVSLREVDLSNVDKVGNYAFASCISLYSVSIGQVKEIGAYAFGACTSLVHIDLRNVEKFGEGAFTESGLVSAYVNADVSMGLFSYCLDLREITLGPGVKMIYYGAFDGTSIKRIVISKETDIDSDVVSAKTFRSTELEEIVVEEDNEYGWYSKDGVLYYTNGYDVRLDTYPLGKRDTSFEIPEGVTRINGGAFMGFMDEDKATKSYLKELYIPASVEKIENSYLLVSLRMSLESIVVDEDNEYFWSYDGVLYGYVNERGTMKEALLACPCGKTGTVTIKDGTQIIDDAAFYYCSYVTDINFPDSISEIKNGAFRQCGIETLVLPSQEVEYENGAFIGCMSLKSVVIPSTLETIPASMFAACYDLAYVEMGSGVKVIENNAFESCTSLQSIDFPDGLEEIGFQSFFGCWSLTSVTIPASVKLIGNNAFCYCTDLQSITVEEGNERFVSEDGVLFTKDMKSLIAYPIGKGLSYDIPFGVENIQMQAFCYAELTSVTMPESLTSIGSNAFINSELQSLIIPGSVKDIANAAFAACGNLETLIISEGVKNLGGRTFNAPYLKVLSIPESVGKNVSFFTFLGYTFYDKNGNVIDYSDVAGDIYHKDGAYKMVHGLPIYTVTFDPNGGSIVGSLKTDLDGKLPYLPESTRDGFIFDGWFMGSGIKVTLDTVFTTDTLVHAEWTEITVPEPKKDDNTTIVAVAAAAVALFAILAAYIVLRQ